MIDTKSAIKKKAGRASLDYYYLSRESNNYINVYSMISQSQIARDIVNLEMGHLAFLNGQKSFHEDIWSEQQRAHKQSESRRQHGKELEEWKFPD